MLLIPVHKKIDWKNAPVVTILLIIANVMIYLGFQLDDDQQRQEAISYYRDSGLEKLELEYAIKYADEKGDFDLSEMLNNVDLKEQPNWILYLQMDPKFMRQLHNGELITWKDPKFNEWVEKRQEFDRLYDSITTVHYGLKTAEPTLLTMFTHMFLHGGFGHLIGNMVFLLAVGMLVEETMDSITFLISYLLAGIGSALFYILIDSDKLIPGIGASGAISGLMGAYAVLYGLKKIRFFYFIGVYFNYITLPAIILLPLWIADQLVQMVLHSDSGVNFLAHLGGLLSGALIAYIVKKTVPSFKQEKVEQVEKTEKLTVELQQARDLINEFKPEAAMSILRRLRREYPDNREILTNYYKCSRIEPGSDEYHSLAHVIFALSASDPATDRLVLDTYNEYLRLARPTTRMNAELACRLANRFIRLKAIAEAERLMNVILAKKLTCNESSRLLQNFFNLLQEQGRGEEILKYKKLMGAAQPA